jgi:general secretion pathway protein D
MEAVALHNEILAQQGVRGPDMLEAKNELAKLHDVKAKEAQAKANHYFNQGKAAFHEERYGAAIEAFDNVLTIIDRGPYGTDWGTLREETEQFLFQARELKAKADEQAARDAAASALNRVRDEEALKEKQYDEKIQNWLAEGMQAFEDERFEIAESLAERVLSLDPTNARAKELIEYSVRARHRQTSAELLASLKERVREWKLDIQQSVVPWSSRPLQWPSQREWDRVSRRASQIGDFGTGSEVSAEDQALKNYLANEKITFAFDGATLPQALDFIRTLKSVNIAYDEEVKSDLEAATITLQVTDLELDSALDLLLRYAGPDYTYSFRNGVVFITNKEGARGTAVLRVHPVGDLTIRLTNFVAPNLILKPAGSEIDESAPLFGRAEEGEQLLGGGAEELMDLITQNIDPESWESGNYTINVSGTDKLVVNHTPEMQMKIAAFLNDLRKFAGLVVTIETRFLSVNDDFLQDIGVDILGLGGERGGLVNLDDVTNGLEDNASAGFDNSGGTVASPTAGNPSAGVFFNNNSDGDYRGRNENMFDRALGSVLSPVGGAVIQYTYLDDTDIGLILRAVNKSRHARLLQAPSLTVYNTQRANITLVNQLSFIQDFDVEVAQTAFIADPIVSIIQDGMTLDVRPTISHDRKYVTLELQPTIATLLRPIPTFQTSLGALTTPVTLQLPETVIQKSQTTVRVPDGGSLVIGGLKNISFVDLESETPFLGKIPIISFFFSRRGTSREVSNLIVIVTARITDLQEEESRFRTPYVR